mmetsp:Transcript_36465/g.87932  ORF Transcript_36465/g.87932 Transcript_36465/m.87932 type:complete len:103 (+) Transcript_36465:460-768(+)
MCMGNHACVLCGICVHHQPTMQTKQMTSNRIITSSQFQKMKIGRDVHGAMKQRGQRCCKYPLTSHILTQSLAFILFEMSNPSLLCVLVADPECLMIWIGSTI